MAKRRLGAFHPEYGWAGDIQKAGALTREGTLDMSRAVRSMRAKKPSCKVAKRHWERGADKLYHALAVDPDNSDQAACFTGKDIESVAHDFDDYGRFGSITLWDKSKERLCVYDKDALQTQVLAELQNTCGPVRSRKGESFDDFQSKDVYRARNARRRKRRS